MGEARLYHTQSLTHASGGPEPSTIALSLWRGTAHPSNLELLNFYARYLTGQYQGMGEALSLDAVRAALDIDQVRREAWAPMTQRLMVLHSIVLRFLPKPKGIASGRRRSSSAS